MRKKLPCSQLSEEGLAQPLTAASLPSLPKPAQACFCYQIRYTV